MGREKELVKDHGQAGPETSGVLNPGAFGAMTAILDVPAQRRRKPRGHNGLTGDCRHRDPQDGKFGRNQVRPSPVKENRWHAEKKARVNFANLVLRSFHKLKRSAVSKVLACRVRVFYSETSLRVKPALPR